MNDRFKRLCQFLDSEKTEADKDRFETEALIIIDWKEDLDEICALILPEDGRFSYTSEETAEAPHFRQTIIRDDMPYIVPYTEDCYCQWELLKVIDEVLAPGYILLEYAPYSGCDCWGLICVTGQEYDTLAEKYGKELYRWFVPGVYDSESDFEKKQHELIYGTAPESASDRKQPPAADTAKKSPIKAIKDFFGRRNK